MTVPTYDKFIEPLLRFLAKHEDGIPAREAHEAAADAVGLTEADRLLTVPTGQAFKTIARGGRMISKRAGWSQSQRASGSDATAASTFWPPALRSPGNQIAVLSRRLRDEGTLRREDRGTAYRSRCAKSRRRLQLRFENSTSDVRDDGVLEVNDQT